jgi:uncharacterized protein (DUF3820 family)
MELVCRKCGSINDYSTEMKSGQNVATCNACGSFIKNIPYREPALYFGKYKGRAIKDIPDPNYLQWVLDKCNPKGSIKQAVINQISKLKMYGQ